MSVVWRFFGLKKSDQTNIYCKCCRTKMIARGGNTSSLLPHLNRKHLLEYEAEGTLVLFTSLSDGISCFLFPVQVMAQQVWRKIRMLVSGIIVGVSVLTTAIDRLASVTLVTGRSMQVRRPSTNQTSFSHL